MKRMLVPFLSVASVLFAGGCEAADLASLTGYINLIVELLTLLSNAA